MPPLLLALLLLGATGTPAAAEPAELAEPAEPSFEVERLTLSVALVEDPDFPRLAPELVERALAHASREFAERFDVAPPIFEVAERTPLKAFLKRWTDPKDPGCAPHYAARYRGTGLAEIDRHRERAAAFWERWPLETLTTFVPEAERGAVKRHADLFDHYAKRYAGTVDRWKKLRTPAGTPLVVPGSSTDRSFVAWTCALLRQDAYDVVITNAFILADLLTEPHPHAVFGKAKIGGIAARSPNRKAMGGQALLASTFGIDTPLAELSELNGEPATFEERARILGAYLLAHEVAHAVFGIPDVFDHPERCLMTSRPGETYREGLAVLDAHPGPCPSCRPYVETRSLQDRARAAAESGEPRRALTLAAAAAKKLPSHFHGGRRARMGEIMLLVSRAYQELGNTGQATRYAEMAGELNPRSSEATLLLAELRAAPALIAPTAIPVAHTTTTATAALRKVP